jgi:hypothetical protein
VCSGSWAQEIQRSWDLEIQLLNLSVYGNDPRIATVIDRQLDGSVVTESATGFDLGLDSDVAFRLRVGRTGPKWSWMVTALYFDGPDSHIMLGPYTSDEASGIETEVVAEELNRSAVAPQPGTGDLNFIAQTHFLHSHLDVAAVRRISEGDGAALGLVMGARFSWYTDRVVQNLFQRSASGWGVSQFGEAESGVLAGPALGARVVTGGPRHRLEASLLQTVVFGEVSFRSTTAEIGANARQSALSANNIHSIPITDLELAWKYRLGRKFTFGVGMYASMWWEVPNAPARAAGSDFATDRSSTVTVAGAGLIFGWGAGSSR